MDKWFVRLLMAFLLALGSASASTVAPLSMRQFTNSVYVLEVEFLKSEPDMMGELCATKWTAKVLNAYRGPFSEGDEITISLIGGTCNGQRLAVAGYENFIREGDRQILGLSAQMTVNGWTSFKIQTNENGEEFVIRNGDMASDLTSGAGSRAAAFARQRESGVNKEVFVDGMMREMQ